jgi:hypothetical protein
MRHVVVTHAIEVALRRRQREPGKTDVVLAMSPLEGDDVRQTAG